MIGNDELIGKVRNFNALNSASGHVNVAIVYDVRCKIDAPLMLLMTTLMNHQCYQYILYWGSHRLPGVTGKFPPVTCKDRRQSLSHEILSASAGIFPSKTVYLQPSEVILRAPVSQ